MTRSGEKTERPTWKRLREARRKGQVAKSRDLASALVWLAIVALVGITGGQVVNQVADIFRDGIIRAITFTQDLSPNSVASILAADAKSTAWSLAPLCVVILIVAILGNYFQIGPLFAFRGVSPDFQKLNPVENFRQRLLQSRPYLELLKTIIKLVLSFTLAGVVLWSERFDIMRLSSQPASQVLHFISRLFVEIGLTVGVAFLIMGAIDLLLQRFLRLRDLKMTKQEIKDDFKEMQGNPMYKQLRSRVHRQILQASIAAARNADVIVVNPTHLAVALKYERAGMNAPIIVAKGAELVALRLREIAGQSRIPVAENAPLARALFRLEIDDEVPEELYEAVAEVLRWVYQLAEERGEPAHA